jgi:hypothetical protein
MAALTPTLLGSAVRNGTNFTQTAGLNRIAIVMTTYEDGVISSATYGGVSMTQAVNHNAYGNYTAIFYILERDLPADGSKSWSTQNDPASYCFMLENAVQSAPLDTSTGNTNGVFPTTVNTTIDNSGQIVVGVLGVDKTATATYGSTGQIQIGNYSSAYSSINCAYKTDPSVGTYGFYWLSSDDHEHVAVTATWGYQHPAGGTQAWY